jgi:hypothetical protein
VRYFELVVESLAEGKSVSLDHEAEQNLRLFIEELIDGVIHYVKRLPEASRRLEEVGRFLLFEEPLSRSVFTLAQAVVGCTPWATDADAGGEAECKASDEPSDVIKAWACSDWNDKDFVKAKRRKVEGAPTEPAAAATSSASSSASSGPCHLHLNYLMFNSKAVHMDETKGPMCKGCRYSVGFHSSV